MEVTNEQTTTTESADLINDEAGLLAKIQGGEPTPAEGGESSIPTETPASEVPLGSNDLPITDLGEGTGEDGASGKGDGTKDGEGDGGGEGPEAGADGEFSNVVDYLNTKHELGLNVGALPEDMSREQEAEIVADLFDKVAGNAQSQLNEFAQVAKILEDKEVKDFIEAKKNGKTLQDYVRSVASTPDGMTDELIISNQLKQQYADMTDDEIKELVADYKDKGMLEKMAKTVRSNIKTQEANISQQNERQAKTEYDNNVKEVGSILENTADVYGVPMTDKIKKNVFLAITQRDDTGMTYLDKALQSNDGVIMATLGLLHMKDLMSAKTSTDTNRRNKKLVDKLFSDPMDLQSSNVQRDTKTNFDPNIANSF